MHWFWDMGRVFGFVKPDENVNTASTPTMEGSLGPVQVNHVISRTNDPITELGDHCEFHPSHKNRIQNRRPRSNLG